VISAFALLADATDGFLASEPLIIGLKYGESLRTSFLHGGFLWIAVLGAAGGAVGAMYNRMAFSLARTRQRLLSGCSSPKTVRAAEAMLASLVLLSVTFWLPVMMPCEQCPSPDSLGCGSARRAAEEGGDSLHARLHGLRHRQWACPAGEYSELATLLHAGQEELIKHLLTRGTEGQVSLATLAVFSPLYLILAVAAAGLAMPAGNFVPSLTLGAALGRMCGFLLLGVGLIPEQEVGLYALIGAAACLGGVTRMTMTIAVILAEVSDDVAIMPACMLALAVARVVGDCMSPSFDHGMIELTDLPYLRESPPRIFEVLTAKDVMAPKPLRLLEVTTVRDILHVLQSSSHNGFPVVSGTSLSMRDQAKKSRAGCLVGVILRRQLLVIVAERAWESQILGMPLGDAAKERFLTSFYVMANVDLEAETARLGAQLSEIDLDAPLDLRSFYDPAPLSVSCLAPLSGVYRLFNEIGVRHIPVLDIDQSLVGIITRKDVQPETISQRLSAMEVHQWATDMHQYWRQMLFGSGTLGSVSINQDRSHAKALRSSSGRAVAIGRRGSTDVSVASACRGSAERRFSLGILRMSTQARIINSYVGQASQNRRTPEPARLIISPTTASLSNSVIAEEAKSPSSPSSNSDNLSRHAKETAAAPSRAAGNDLSTGLLARSLLLSPTVLGSDAPVSIDESLRTSYAEDTPQPSLGQSLQASASRQQRQRPGGSRRSSRSNSPSSFASVKIGSALQKKPWHFAKLRCIEGRRASAPAILLSLPELQSLGLHS